MAVTGGRITASIYRINGNDVSFAGVKTGRTYNWPNVGVQFYDLPPGVTANGFTMNAVIEVLPTGLNQPSTKYYTPSTAAQILSGGS